MIVLGLCAVVIVALGLALYSMSLDNDELRYENQHLTDQNDILSASVERLLDDVTKLASEARHRDSHGRFVKK